MSKLRSNPMSPDGFVAGPNQSVHNPLGVGGMRLHEWAFPLEVWRAMQGSKVVEESMANIGAPIIVSSMAVHY